MWTKYCSNIYVPYTLDDILDEGSKFQNRMFISFPHFIYCLRDEVYCPKLGPILPSRGSWRYLAFQMGTIQRLLCITFMTSQSHLQSSRNHVCFVRRRIQMSDVGFVKIISIWCLSVQFGRRSMKSIREDCTCDVPAALWCHVVHGCLGDVSNEDLAIIENNQLTNLIE